MASRTRDWSEQDKARAADLTASYVDGLSRALAEFDVDQDELDDVLLDLNVEQCPSCAWYVDSHALIPPDGDDEPDGCCPNCR